MVTDWRNQIARMRSVVIGAVLVGLVACGDRNQQTAASHRAAAEVRIAAGAAERLAGAIKLATISHADTAAFDSVAFEELHEYLQQQFPHVHTKLERETVAGYSLLYKWQGSDKSLKPVLLLGHIDVVPIEPGTESKWEKPPFSGIISDGFIWGRGAIDNKSAVVGTLEAVETLLNSGFQPKRTVYLAYGHDEEVGGTRGARAVAELLKARGIQFEMVLDEGGVIGDGLLKGVSAPTALVGVAEKGFASVELSTRTDGGHSSLPPRESAIGILGTAVAKLEQRQMPARLEGATRQMFDRIAPEFPALQRALFANLWLSRPIVLKKLQQTPTTNAMIRTTTAPTIFQAGTKENVLASNARAIVNFRILPGDSVAGVVRHVKEAVDDDRVAVRLSNSFVAEPSSVTSTESRAFLAVERTVTSLSPAMIVSPYLVVVVTDARYYAPLSESVLRFLPVKMQQPDLQRMHGTNERLSVANYEWAIRFYHQLITNVAGS